MRKENVGKSNATENRSRVQGYHEHSFGSGVNYAFCGFSDNKYFTSDRYIKLDEHWNRADGKPLKGIGFEIECECSAIHSDSVLATVLERDVFKCLPDGLFKLQSDGSLGGNSSAECITQVMTKEFIRNHYAGFKTLWERFNMYTITTENSNCGMHANLSLGLFGTSKKVQDDCIRKLYYIINKHYNFFKVAFNRTNDTYYCRQMDYSIAKTMDLNSMPSAHSNALNYSHYVEGRIEIRLVGGQKNFPCFRNTCETIFHLIDAVKVLSWEDCDDLAKIFSGCNSYVFDRIKDNCYRAGVITMDDVNKIRDTVVNVHYL